jgi:anthranilate synthase component 2
MKILVFDNYDSFTYNLVHLVEKILHIKTDIFRNDQISLEDVKKYDKIILSPGPGIPEEAGMLIPLIKEYGKSKSILGVCLGHQAIGQAYGAQLVNLDTVFHGVATVINIDKKIPEAHRQIFNGLPEHPVVGRYHSWVVGKDNFPSALQITAEDENGYIMALRHREYDVQGVQFHPESVLTPGGERLMRNWLES